MPCSQKHDANGNLTSDGTYTYEWDMLNHLRRVKQGSTVKADYWYDAEGRRVAKKVGSTTMYYTLDGWREIEEYEGSTLKRQFVYGSFIDEPLIMDVNVDSDGTAYMMSGTVDGADARYYYHQNWQYSVLALTDTTGKIVEGYEYDPYGKQLVFADGDDGDTAVNFNSNDLQSPGGISAQTIGNPFMYTGRRFDGEAGNYYYRHRYYNSTQGRFLSRDPILEPQIVFVVNNLSTVDYSSNQQDIVLQNLFLLFEEQFVSFPGKHPTSTLTLDAGPRDQKSFSNFYSSFNSSPYFYLDPDGKAYFAYRPLDGGPNWKKSEDTLEDGLNVQLLHEHLFFEDGKLPSDVGYFKEGMRSDSPSNYTKYTKIDETYNDCVMRAAIKNIKCKPYKLIGKNQYNCQDFAAAALAEYAKIVENKKKLRIILHRCCYEDKK